MSVYLKMFSLTSHLSGQASSLHYEAEELRQQCVQFLTYIKAFIHR